MTNTKIVNASFIVSATSIGDSPAEDIAEVAFLGRSNVGKSSILNALVKQKNLAKSSSTPGKTKLINYFQIDCKNYDDNKKLHMRFVDLPGFGYAKVSKTLKEDWSKNLTTFLQNRQSVKIFIQLIDSRHIDLDIDKNVNLFLEEHKRGDQIIVKVFTKIDKLKKSELSKLKNKYFDSIFISNSKKIGIEKLEQKIIKYMFSNIVVKKNES